MKNILKNVFLFLFIIFFSTGYAANEDDIYKKIDLFSEVLDKINKEYVDDVNQSEAMDAAINGVLQSLDPYSAYMSPDSFKNMRTETSGEFGGPQGVLIIENIIDDIARFLKKDPAEIRKRNFYQPTGRKNITHYGQKLDDANVIHEIYGELLRCQAV